MNNKTKHIIIALVSLVALFATLFIYTKIDNEQELQSAKLGYPAYFLEQDFSGKYDNRPFFPTWDRIDLSGKSPVVKFHFFRMVADLAIIFVICEVLVYILETIDFAIRKEK